MDPNTTSSSSPSLVVSYLMNSCGLSEVQAVKASKKLNFKTTSRADIVKTLLERSGFTKPDITKLIIRAPKALLFARRSILKQKLNYFFSKDISRQEAIKALSHNPGILFFSLEDRIIPCFDFFKSIVGNDRDTLNTIRNVFEIKLYYSKSMEEVVLSNIQVLKDENVPEEIIIKFLIRQPRVFTIGTGRFKEAVEEVKCMGINPSKTAFTTSIRMSIWHAKKTLETKLDAFRKWWSEEQIQTAIRKLTRFMEISVKKFEAIMNFAVTQMGCSPSSLALRPSIFYLNLEKRIIPRFSIHKILISKGLTGSKPTLLTILQSKDEVFLKRYVIPYKVEVPEVWQIYNQASNGGVSKDSQNEEVTFCPESPTENVAAPPKVAKVVGKSQTGKPDEELEKEEEANKATKPKKILRKSKKKVDEMQGGGAKKDKGGHSNIELGDEEKDKFGDEEKDKFGDEEKDKFGEEEKDKSKEETAAVPIVEKVSEGSQASGIKRKVLKKVTKPKKVLKKSKKKIEEVQGSAAKKEEWDTSKEEEESTDLPMVGKLLQDEELEKEEEENKATKPKKILRKSKKKMEEMQGGGAKKDKGGDSNIEFDEEEKDKSNLVEETASVPIVEKASEDSQASGLKRKVSNKVTKPKKVLKKSKKKIEEVQGSAAKKEEEDTSKEEEESTALPMAGKGLEDEELGKEEEANTATKPKKILRKSKKKVEEMQGGGAKKDKGGDSNIEFDEEEKDKSNREEEIAAVPIVGKVSEGSQASGLKRKVLKKVTKPKKVLKKSKKKIEEVQGSAAKKEEKDTSKEEEESTALPMVGKVLEDSPKKNLVTNFGVEALELLQVSNRHTMEDSQREEVTSSPKSPTKTAPPKVAKMADKSQTGKPKKKASSSDLMEQDEELKKEEEAKKATKPKKFLRKAKKKLEEVQGGAKKDKGAYSNIEFKEGEDKFEEEEEIATVPIVGNVLEGSQINVLKRKVALDKEEDSNKVKRPKKILVKSKEKVEEVQGGAAKEKGHSSIEVGKEEKDKSKAEEVIAAVPIVEDVVEGCEVSTLKRKVALNTDEDSKKVKKPKKVLKKYKKKVDKVQGSANKEEEDKAKEVGELAAVLMVEKVSEEKDKSKAEEEIAAVPMVEEVVEGCEVSTLKRKVALNKNENSKKVKKPKRF
ncbi:calponin homology domain-containing protein DDB_G0272472-like [Papaver somniferum]|uniref:calponin homology domain-containing protein DDB_G0272472-like n=1 Tax=Papaver somniferum TaxID=3469 RepID=UPI000E6F7D47|nr:calponin homology domain-containing protein DDB_G0272472-like [Papaver somniferum]